MEGGAGRGLGCQKIMDGKVNNGNSSNKVVPSCCLKAMASTPELDAKCHSTVVSGWFSDSQSSPGHNYNLSCSVLFSLIRCRFGLGIG